MPPRSSVLYGVAAAGLAAFFWLGREVTLGRTLPFDTAVRQAVHACGSPWLTSLMEVFTQLGGPTFLVVASIVLCLGLVSNSRRQAATLLAFSMVGVTLLSDSFKLVYHRLRPPAFFGYHEPLTYSFPSGHALTSICFYGVLAAIVTSRIRSKARRRAIWGLSAALVLLVGFSRIYLGVHYPTDVLGGYDLGLLWLIVLLRAAPLPGGRWFRLS